jgi:endonuclease I
MRNLCGRVITPAIFLLVSAALPSLAFAQAVDFNGGYSQNFDSLASSGTTGTALPPGWALLETGTNANTSYGIDNGGSNSGNTYSYGSTGAAERALGAIQSGSLASRFGLGLVNRTGASLSSVSLSYIAEQWRLGATGREDRLDFQYSLNATGVADGAGSWVDFNALDAIAPITAGTVGALDGNAAANRAAVNAELSGLSWAPDQTLWIRWVDFNAPGNDDGLAIDDLVIGQLTDVPPTLLSTTPINGATGVAVGSAVRLRFSEPVDLSAAQVSFSCAAQAVAFSSNSPASEIVLTPTQPLPYSANCSLQIPAAAVTDRDGTPDPLGADISLGFATEADLPPQVVSTTPANGAVNVAPAVQPSVQFSEVVNLASPAFSLECDAGGAIGLTHPASGQNIVLSPQALLQEGDRCTLRILAAQISDAGGQFLPANVVVVFDVSAGAGSYYSQVNTSSPGQLRCSLHHVIRGHTAFPYSSSTGTSTWTILELAEEDPTNPAFIIDAYRNRRYAKGSDRAGTGSGITYNREHSWPNSLGFGSTTGNLGLPNAPYTDAHMLYLTDTGYNADRGNMPYADCTQSGGCAERATEFNQGVGGGTGVYPGNSNWFQGPNGNQGSFQVWSGRKGDLARAVMYMAIRYEGGVHPSTGQSEPDLELTDNRAQIVATSSSPAYMGLMSALLAWHQADPPNAAEVLRNDVVQSFQGNRNPFIDHPEWATQALFTSTTPSTCELVTPQPPAIFSNGFEAAP